MTTDERRWSDLLDEFESVMARQRTAIERGDIEMIDELTFRPPGDLPPLPPVLVERVRRIAEANTDLVRVAWEAAERVRPPARSVTRRATARPVRSQLDLRA